jgi:hypothetical protein
MASCFGQLFGGGKSSLANADVPAVRSEDMSEEEDNSNYISEGSESEDFRESDLNTDGVRRLFIEEQNLTDKLVGVVVTIVSGSTYDPIFVEVPPKTVPGERISVYRLEGSRIGELLEQLNSSEPSSLQGDNVMVQLVQDIRTVEADSVTFNFECCSGCSDTGFPKASFSKSEQVKEKKAMLCGYASASSCKESRTASLNLIKFALDHGYTVMCSDFSLKALIKDWSEEILGPNPFLKVGECDCQFQLDFVPADLQQEEVPQQLQVVGELCQDQGKAIVKALGGTILYTVNPSRALTEAYTMKILTVVSDWSATSDTTPGSVPEALKCSIGVDASERRGLAGHVTLTYASGGQLVTSMGHWIELTHIDTSIDSILRVARANFGAEEAEEFERELLTKTTEEERSDYCQMKSRAYVQQSVPSRMKCRTKF